MFAKWIQQGTYLCLFLIFVLFVRYIGLFCQCEEGSCKVTAQIVPSPPSPLLIVPDKETTEVRNHPRSSSISSLATLLVVMLVVVLVLVVRVGGDMNRDEEFTRTSEAWRG